VPAALAFDDPPGGMQDLVAQSLWFRFGQVAVEGEEPQPGQQITGDGGGLAPGGIDLVDGRWQMSQAGAFRAADPVLDPGLRPPEVPCAKRAGFAQRCRSSTGRKSPAMEPSKRFFVMEHPWMKNLDVTRR